MNLTDLNSIKPLLQRHHLWADKSLGQNFLINQKVLDTMIESSKINDQDTIIEIGPGLGVLTQELAQKAKQVHSIELDPKMLEVLNETLVDYTNINIIPGNALKIAPESIIKQEPYKVIANIPYYITSPLLNHFLQTDHKPNSITFLIQKEVAEKICQTTPDMSVISLQVQLFGKPKYIATVPNSDFYPSPKVDSAIIHIELHQKGSPDYLTTEQGKTILKTAQQAFLNGRKKLSNTLPHLKEALLKLNLQDQRPQHLNIKNWQDLLKI